MTKIQAIPANVLDRFTREIEREKLEQRREAIATLTTLNAELSALDERHDAAVLAADAAVDAARETLRQAEETARTARQRKLSERYSLDARRELVRARLEGELQPQATADALARVESLRDQFTAIRLEPGNTPASRALAASEHSAVVRRLEWCDSARSALLELQFLDVDVTAAVSRLMGTMPA